MKYLNPHILCLESKEFIKTPENPTGLVPKGTYDALKSKGQIQVHGRGGNGCSVLIEFETMPLLYRNLVQQAFGDPYEYVAIQPIRDLITVDVKAIEFFDRYELPDGRFLPDEHKREYVKAAGVMRMIDKVYADKKWLKKDLKIDLGRFWEIVAGMKETKAAGLPGSTRKLKPKHDEWKVDGYKGLISKKFCNTNRLKVTINIENLILSLYAADNKPYASDVLDAYHDFMQGKKELVDVETGELFNPVDYLIDGEPIELSKTTVWNIINNPVNRITVDKKRMSRKEFNDTHRPHVMRKSALYAFSKLTMDDISIPFKMPDGKRAWAYQIWDVASGCVVGKAFSRSTEDGSGKDRALFTEAIKDMFRLITVNGWGMPYEIEVEQHISNTFKGGLNEDGEFVADLLSDGYVFPFVRWCNAANPQEKRAEGFVKGKKYKLQNKRDGFQRRPFAKLEANRMNEDKNKVRYEFEEVVANELADIEEWNNSKHPRQDLYPKLTRWQVLEQHQNPNLPMPHMPTIAKYIGRKTPTSINRTFAEVQYGKYKVSSADLHKLNSTIVTAYYIKDKQGLIPEVYLYQDDKYVCTAYKMDAFNESKAEATDADANIMQAQQAHINGFDKRVKERVSTLRKVAIIKKVSDNKKAFNPNYNDGLEDETPVYNEPALVDKDYWKNKALNDL